MRNGIIMVIVLMTLLLSSASALAHTHTTAAESPLCSLMVQEPMQCSFDDVSADGASEHQRPAPHPRNCQSALCVLTPAIFYTRSNNHFTCWRTHWRSTLRRINSALRRHPPAILNLGISPGSRKNVALLITVRPRT